MDRRQFLVGLAGLVGSYTFHSAAKAVYAGDDVKSIILRCESSLKNKDLEDVLAGARSIKSIDPKVWRAYELEGTVYVKRKQYLKAESEFLRGLSVAGEDDRAKLALYKDLCCVYHNLGDSYRAVQYLQKGLEIDPDDTLLNNVKSKVLGK